MSRGVQQQRLARDRPREDHERGLAAFMFANRRGRFIALLEGRRTRAKLRASLAHFNELDSRWLLEVPAMDAVAERAWITQKLGGFGAPAECYLVSESPRLDAQRMQLEEALLTVLSQDLGTLISCIPGELGLYKGEDPGALWILRRETGTSSG